MGWAGLSDTLTTNETCAKLANWNLREFVLIIILERETASRGGAERERERKRERESQADSTLSTEPWVGVDPSLWADVPISDPSRNWELEAQPTEPPRLPKKSF